MSKGLWTRPTDKKRYRRNYDKIDWTVSLDPPADRTDDRDYLIIREGQKVIAKPNTWFDEGTVAELLIDFKALPPGSGLFLGTRNGQWDEEQCHFDEFDIRPR